MEAFIYCVAGAWYWEVFEADYSIRTTGECSDPADGARRIHGVCPAVPNDLQAYDVPVSGAARESYWWRPSRTVTEW